MEKRDPVTQRTPEKYRFLPDIATADIAFDAYGKTLDALFTNAALATCATIANLKTITPRIAKAVKLENKDIERLLFELLEEIIYLKDAELLLFSAAKVAVKKDAESKGGAYHLTAVLKGEKINHAKHELHNDVKAVTMHLFQIAKARTGYKARVVLDV
ncbi:archease [Candidatus Woesearchaeota archaeon]|nr:archease [Candidatus Woesearchaeota archaeon]